MRIEVETHRGDVLDGDLGELVELDDESARELTESLDEEFMAHERELFASHGASGGAPWQRLDPRYARRKARTHPGRGILVRAGDLMRSLTQRGGAHIARTEEVDSGIHEHRLGSAEQTATIHIWARHDPRDILPVRDPMQHTRPQWRRYLDVAVSFFRRLVRRRLGR